MSLFVVHVAVHVKPEAVDAFRAATLVNARGSIQEPGVARFDVMQTLVATGERGYQNHRRHRYPGTHPVERGRFFASAVPRRRVHELSVASSRSWPEVELAARSAQAGQVEAFVGRYPFPSQMKRSARSVKRSAMTCALRASGNTFGQSLNRRLVVMQVERWYS